jgi:RNA polymerase sigma factor (sigma-70 family)
VQIDNLQSVNADLLEEVMPAIRALAREVFSMHFPVRNLVPYEDVVSEGVVGALQAARYYDPEQGSFLIYARAYIRGHMVDMHRRKGGDQVAIFSHSDKVDTSMTSRNEFFLCRQSDPDTEVLAREHRDLVSEAIDALPPRQASILRRTFLDEVKLKELSGELGVGMPRISQLRRKALGQMRELLEERGVDSSEFEKGALPARLCV